eukprot:1379112-Amorphochlora_amoeboformis.AAC.1
MVRILSGVEGQEVELARVRLDNLMYRVLLSPEAKGFLLDSLLCSCSSAFFLSSLDGYGHLK